MPRFAVITGHWAFQELPRATHNPPTHTHKTTTLNARQKINSTGAQKRYSWSFIMCAERQAGSSVNLRDERGTEAHFGSWGRSYVVICRIYIYTPPVRRHHGVNQPTREHHVIMALSSTSADMLFLFKRSQINVLEKSKHLLSVDPVLLNISPTC